MKSKNSDLSKFNDYDNVFVNIKNKYLIIKKFNYDKYDKNEFYVKQIDEIKNNFRNYKNYYIIINE